MDANVVVPEPDDQGRGAGAEHGGPPGGAGSEGQEPPPSDAAGADPPSPFELVALGGLEVFSKVAHELRGPLMALATSAELLVADLDDLAPEQIRYMVGGIHYRALWLQELVENLLATASMREGRLRLNLQTLNLIEVVAEVRQVVYPLLRRRDQRLRIYEPSVGRPPEIRADGRRLGQVLVNLILNASKFSPPGTAVEVRLATRPGALRVTVSDRGPGLPAGAVEHLFEPFFRAPASELSSRRVGLGAPAPEGVGLGLAIVKEIVARHGGRVGAGNRRGGGAQFWFELPLAVVAPPA